MGRSLVTTGRMVMMRSIGYISERSIGDKLYKNKNKNREHLKLHQLVASRL